MQFVIGQKVIMPESHSTAMIRSPRRIAVVQFGDFWEAKGLIMSGEKEPYFGMRSSIETLLRLFGDNAHLVISLHQPAGRHVVGAGEYCGYSGTRDDRLAAHGLINGMNWTRQLCRELDRFAPTHLLMRTSGLPGWRLIRHGVRRNWSILAMFANSFDSPDWIGRYIERKTAQIVNHPNVFLVANHRDASTRSMIELGVNPAKAIAYDWPGARHPSQNEPKQLDPAASCHLLYAASMVHAKGIGDLIEAVGILKRKGMNVRLTALGVGPAHEEMRELARRVAPDDIKLPGRVENDVLFDLMRRCTMVCVPSRHDFQEGGSLTLTEALASRTPSIISDQRLFKRTFNDGEGVRIFEAGNPAALAYAIETVAKDPALYAHLSRTTADAFGRAECRTTFADVIERWRATF